MNSSGFGFREPANNSSSLAFSLFGCRQKYAPVRRRTTIMMKATKNERSPTHWERKYSRHYALFMRKRTYCHMRWVQLKQQKKRRSPTHWERKCCARSRLFSHFQVKKPIFRPCGPPFSQSEFQGKKTPPPPPPLRDCSLRIWSAFHIPAPHPNLFRGPPKTHKSL